jgi:hypothetical protein
MRKIVQMHFGSTLYGTSTPASDIDYKAVFIPEARDILLQRAPQSINDAREKGFAEKNYAGEVEIEMFSLQRYLDLLAQGHMVAIDMLFAPSTAWTEHSPIWLEIRANRERLLSKKVDKFLAYIQTQAAKYGIRGSRVAQTRQALELLIRAAKMHGGRAKLWMVRDEILAICGPFSAIVESTSPAGAKIEMWEVCNRKLPMAASIDNGREILQRMFDEYGKRALMAERQEGVDWKALSHAIRAAHQALELLRTGHITFPLPNAGEIKAIKAGERRYQDVAAELEDLAEQVAAAAGNSRLREDPDLQWIEDFVANTYYDEVC